MVFNKKKIWAKQLNVNVKSYLKILNSQPIKDLYIGAHFSKNYIIQWENCYKKANNPNTVRKTILIYKFSIQTVQHVYFKYTQSTSMVEK